MTRSPRNEPAGPHSRRGVSLIQVLIGFGIMAVAGALFLPVTRSAREPARRTQCKNNLKQIGLALHNYHDAHGMFPPAHSVDDEGKPRHSWRTALLPYVDQAPLYATINSIKPWDDPANTEIAGTRLPSYLCPSHATKEGHTTYLAVVAPGSCFDKNWCMKLSEIKDGASNTMMIIESPLEQTVPWMAPFDADESLIMGLSPKTKLAHNGGLNFLYADGAVRFLSVTTDAKLRRALITASGNDNADLSGF